jgi:uncharacterized protein YceK
MAPILRFDVRPRWAREARDMKKTLLLIPVVVLSLSGCSAVADLIHSESEEHYENSAALFESSTLTAEQAAWLPSDASDITLRHSTKGDTAVIGFASDSELAGCASTDRLSLPAYAVEWGPDDEAIVKMTTVQSCGDWVFVPTAEGWFGWTPSAPGEAEAA